LPHFVLFVTLQALSTNTAASEVDDRFCLRHLIFVSKMGCFVTIVAILLCCYCCYYYH